MTGLKWCLNVISGKRIKQQEKQQENRKGLESLEQQENRKGLESSEQQEKRKGQILGEGTCVDP